MTGPHAPGPHRPGPARTGAHRWVRPYVVTRGRVRTARPMLVHSLVWPAPYRAEVAAGLPPESRRLYERASTAAARTPVGAESLAELSAHCGVPLGVARVLLADLAAAGHLTLGSDVPQSPAEADMALLGRVRDGLLAL